MAPASARAARTIRHSMRDTFGECARGRWPAWWKSLPGGTQCGLGFFATGGDFGSPLREVEGGELVGGRSQRTAERAVGLLDDVQRIGRRQAANRCEGSGCARRFTEHRDLQRIDHFARLDQYVPAPTPVGRPSLVRRRDEPDPRLVGDKQDATFGLECGHRERAGSGQPERVSCHREHQRHLAHAYLQQPPDDIGEGELDRDGADVRHSRDQLHAVPAVDVDPPVGPAGDDVAVAAGFDRGQCGVRIDPIAQRRGEPRGESTTQFRVGKRLTRQVLFGRWHPTSLGNGGRGSTSRWFVGR